MLPVKPHEARRTTPPRQPSIRHNTQEAVARFPDREALVWSDQGSPASRLRRRDCAGCPRFKSVPAAVIRFGKEGP